MSECWTQYQLIEKAKTYPWLIVRNRKLGCKTCRNVKKIKTQQNRVQTDGIHLSSAWINVSVETTSIVWSLSWCLKMFKHRNSGGHKAAERILATAKNKVMEQMSARWLAGVEWSRNGASASDRMSLVQQSQCIAHCGSNETATAAIISWSKWRRWEGRGQGRERKGKRKGKKGEARADLRGQGGHASQRAKSLFFAHLLM